MVATMLARLYEWSMMERVFSLVPYKNRTLSALGFVSVLATGCCFGVFGASPGGVP